MLLVVNIRCSTLSFCDRPDGMFCCCPPLFSQLPSAATVLLAVPSSWLGGTTMIGGCEMPPDGERPLADAERAMLIAWASCPK